MADEGKTIYRIFYKRMLALYPRAFREQFGESLEQTFNDLCNEQEGHGSRLFSLTVYLSIDTGIGIVKEHVLHFSKRSVMREVLTDSKLAPIVGAFLALPGVLMLSLLLLGIEPPLGPLRPILEPPGGSHLLGSLFVLALIIVLPAVGFFVNAGRMRKAVFGLGNIAAATLAGLLLVVPFIILQAVNRKDMHESFPFALFVVMWLLATLFTAILIPIARILFSKNSFKLHPAALTLGFSVLLIIALMLGGLLVDQMPCFLGVPNCD
ncbi:MAG: hypothetical protein LC730_01190 [Acidobacteria bacterium]|nr:hypothetical protein [Acidobacteriota bacterium]MCA1608062.1 hypothetical protein [Acidobacteriota bacterium]